jgi:hypothetical protein
LIDYGRDSTVREKLENATHVGSKFVLAPSMMSELTVGVVKGGATYFEQNKKLFAWLQVHSGNILDLARPFMGKIPGFPSKRSQVETHHYVQRIDMVVNSQTFEEFLKCKDAVGSVWTDVDKAEKIHSGEVDKEFTALEKFAQLAPGSFDLAAKFCETFGPVGNRPEPQQFREHFSAGLEYVESCIGKIKRGANPRKNNRGIYGDFQLLCYLGDLNINLVTSEDFSADIKHSPQRTRIVGLNAL